MNRLPFAHRVAFVLCITSAAGLAAAKPLTRSSTMHDFAFLFRTQHVPAGADLARRNAAARDWALARRAEETLRSASPLEDTGAVVDARGVTPLSSDQPVASVLVIGAESLDAAVVLAQSHPGLAFGTTIEVRPVKVVAPPPK